MRSRTAFWRTNRLATIDGQAVPLFHFRLRAGSKAALGWVLSAESEALMREQLRTADCENGAQFDLLVERLKPAAG